MYGYVNIIVVTCQAMVQRESFIICHDLWNSWDCGLDVFSVATIKFTRLIKPCSKLGLLFCLTCQFFLQLRQDLLQVTIAFLKIFSLSDREKVLGDAFDRHCWAATGPQPGTGKPGNYPPEIFANMMAFTYFT